MTNIDRRSVDVDLNFDRAKGSIRRSGLLAAGTFAACVALAAIASVQVTPKYTADAKLLFTKTDRTAALTGLGAAGDTRQLQSLLVDQTPLTTQIEVIRSRPLLQQTIDILELKNDEGQPLAPEELDRNLELRIIGATDVVEVLFTNPDPQVSADVANTLIDQYRQYSIETSRSEAREAKEFVLAQLPQTEITVRQAEADLQNFLESNQIGVLDEEARSLVARLEALSGQIATVQADLESAGTQASVLQNRLRLNPQDALAVGILSQNPGVQEAILSLQTVERDLATQKARFSDDSPIVRQLESQRASLQAFVQQQIQEVGGAPGGASRRVIQGTPNQQNITQALIQTFLDTDVAYQGLQQQLGVLKAYESDYQNRLRSVPSLSAEQRNLERRVVAAETTYSSLLTRLQELQVQENEAVYNSRVIQPATPPLKPDSGDRLKILAFGVMGGAILAIAIIIVSEMTKPKFPSSASKDSILSNQV